MRKSGSIFCGGCAHLFVIKKQKPMCVATAVFIKGPLRNKIDIVGLTSAERRNLKNDCSYRKPVSIKAWEIKRWLFRRMTDGIKVEAGNLTDYAIEEEAQFKNKLDSKEKQPKAETKPEKSKLSKESTHNKKEHSGAKVKSPSKTKKTK